MINMKNRRSVTIAALVIGAFLSFQGSAFAANLADVHVAKGIQCSGCHAENPPSKAVKTAKCQSCHGDYAALAEKTKDMKPTNVHANHLGDLDCKECHQGYKPDKLACDECHQFKFTMPKK